MRTLYTVVTDDDAGDLSDSINEAFEDGWTLVGGISQVAVYVKGDSTEYREHALYVVTIQYAQAMTKQMPEEEYQRLQAEMAKEMESDQI